MVSYYPHVELICHHMQCVVAEACIAGSSDQHSEGIFRWLDEYELCSRAPIHGFGNAEINGWRTSRVTFESKEKVSSASNQYCDEKATLHFAMLINMATANLTDSMALITYEEVKRHATPNDCWLVIHGHVYDLSQFEHPGGAASTSCPAKPLSNSDNLQSY